MSSAADQTPEEAATERGYITGKHTAWRQVLWSALRELNICKDPADDVVRELARVGGILEDTRSALRRLCSELGVEFDEDVHPMDIVERIAKELR